MPSTKEQPISLLTLRDGAVLELFDRKLQEVVDNIQDLNTPAGQKRSITLTVSFKPDEERLFSKLAISCNSKLAGSRVFESMAVIDVNRDGIAQAREVVAVQAQTSFFKPESEKVVGTIGPTKEVINAD